ncbi:thioesterase II family protein [Frankia sp. CiP3]|uniref:thioesterase II family protein n=1 Tax=Frankia sp. CiP3 TaxID=2880971 RepID=UPI001EF57E4E|nr:alpha/beta fold hydrolase [Frankia sp. CiP3]
MNVSVPRAAASRIVARAVPPPEAMPHPEAVRLVCFPHAGGGPAAYRGWPAGLAPRIELWNATMPGRGRRRDEPPARGWDRLVANFAAAIAAETPPPYALFGHSLGALVAFEVARCLTVAGVPPTHLFVSGRAAPGWREPSAVPPTDDELVSYVDRCYGGIPAAVRAVPELMEHFVPLLRADLELAAGYRFQPGPSLPVTVTALAGDRDPAAPAAGVSAWAGQAGAGFEAHVFPGGHFFLHDQQQAVLRLVRRRLTATQRERHQDDRAV